MAAADPVSVAARLYPALANGWRDVLDELLATDFVGETTPGLPLELGGTYQGPAAMRRDFWGAIGRAFDVVAEPERFDATSADRVVVTGVYRGSARATGRTFRAPFVHTLTIRDGWITGLTQVTDSHAWHAALEGLDVTRSDTTAPHATPPRDTTRSAEPLTAEPGSVAVSNPDAPVTLAIHGGVARLHLNRGAAANAIDQAVAAGIREAAQRCAQDASVRVVVITGAGDRFSAGGDLKLFADSPADELPTLLDAMITDFHIGLAQLAALEVPVVCVVQGAAAGGALGLLHASDIVLAAEGTKFALGFSALALSGDGGSTWYLPRIIGPKAAALMYLENRVLDADTALTMGLVSEVVPADALKQRTDELVARLVAGPTAALGAMRSLLRRSADHSLVEQFDLERRTIVAMARHPHATEGIAAFVQKRRPDFGNVIRGDVIRGDVIRGDVIREDHRA